MPNAREAAFLLALGRVVHVVATISILVMLTAELHLQGFGTKLEPVALLFGLAGLVLGALIKVVVLSCATPVLIVRILRSRGITSRSGKVYTHLVLVESAHIKHATPALMKSPRIRPDAIAIGLGASFALSGYGFWSLIMVMPLLVIEVYSIRRQLEKFL
jgi:hypothetical protein